MSQTIKFADNTTLANLQVCNDTTVYADGLSRSAKEFQILASDTTVEAINTLFSNKVKTVAMYIIDGTTTSTAINNYTIIANGVSLKTVKNDSGVDEQRIIITMAKETDEEVENNEQEIDIKTLLMNTEMDFSLLKQKVAALEAK